MFNGSDDFNATETPESHSSSLYHINVADSNWIMTSAFIIFTMQTGFGMLESGCVSRKNEMNIMMKNVSDIFLGGATYWAVGYGLSFGTAWTCPFFAWGDFFLDPSASDPLMGHKFTAFIFQLSFATTATTIVSGAMAERCSFKAYCAFSFFNTIVYCLPAGWVWGDHGFLKRLGAVDIAGSGPVHLVGGASALASAYMLGPRLGRYDIGNPRMPLGTPVNCAMGLFVLWWGWLAFNSGSTYGLSGAKWAYSAKASVMTMLSSFGGGFIGLSYTLIVNKGKANILDIINSVLGSLVAVTAGCFLYNAWTALVIGIIGGLITSVTAPLFDKIHIDDPVGATAVHCMSGIWGVIAVGLFAQNPFPMNTTDHRNGLFIDGKFYLLGVQVLAAVCQAVYSFFTSIALLWAINKVIPIRMTPREELIGADLSEHFIKHSGAGVSRAVSALIQVGETALDEVDAALIVGSNPGHEHFLSEYIKNKLLEESKVNGKLFAIFQNYNEKTRSSSKMAWTE